MKSSSTTEANDQDERLVRSALGRVCRIAAALAACIVLYIFSIGPALRIGDTIGIPSKALWVVYYPVVWILHKEGPVSDSLMAYIDWWRPLKEM